MEILSFERAKIFADMARRHGNGAFDLSARANLQMRGVSVDKVEVVQDEIAALGLLDSDPRAEAVRISCRARSPVATRRRSWTCALWSRP